MENQKVKILIVGSVNGSITKLFDLVDNIQAKKGKFDILFCTGNFFPLATDDKLGLKEQMKSVAEKLE
jgi:hypothetical protein